MFINIWETEKKRLRRVRDHNRGPAAVRLERAAGRSGVARARLVVPPVQVGRDGVVDVVSDIVALDAHVLS